MKEFPLEFTAKKAILFYPGQPADFSGDVLEIGPGRGDLLLKLAGDYPDRQYVAIEVGTKRYMKLIPRIEKRNLRNILLIQGDARIVIPRFYREKTFERIYVLFPDPWPKKRHYPHRLMSIEFIAMLARVLKIGGELFFASDSEFYTEWVVENEKEIDLLERVGELSVDKPLIAEYIPTYFEQKWRNEGRSIYYQLFRRI